MRVWEFALVGCCEIAMAKLCGLVTWVDGIDHVSDKLIRSEK